MGQIFIIFVAHLIPISCLATILSNRLLYKGICILDLILTEIHIPIQGVLRVLSYVDL